MSEEKKHEEKKAEVKKPKAAEHKPKEKHEEAPPQPKVVKVHHLKLSRMNLEQLTHALEACNQHMGGLDSQYGRFLLARQAFLKEQKPTVSLRKKAA